MQTINVDLLDIDPFALVEDEPPWEPRQRTLEHTPGGHPHNQQDHAGDGSPDVGAADKLKLASRIDLKPGEKLLSSQRIRTRADAEGWDLMTAEVDTPNGRQVRLGIIHPDDSKHWTAGPDPKRSKRIEDIKREMVAMDAVPDDDVTDEQADRYDELHSELVELQGFDEHNLNRTAAVTPSSVAAMRSDLENGVEKARAWSKKWNKYWADHEDEANEQSDLFQLSRRRPLTPTEQSRLDELTDKFEEIGDPDPTFLEGSVPGGPEGDLHYKVGGIDDGEGGWKIELGIKPPDADDNWYIGGDDDEARFEGSDVRKLLKALQELESGTGRSVEAMNARRAVPSMSFALLSRSPAVQLMLLARSLEANETFSRRGNMVTVNRGKGGKFAKKGAAVVDAVADAADATPAKTPARRSSVAKALASGNPNALDGMSREALRREAKARGLEPPRGVSEDVLKDMLWDDEHQSKGVPERPMAAAEEAAAEISRLGSEQEIVDALAGKSAAELRAVGEEIGVRTHRDMNDPDKIRAHIARSVAVGLSNVDFRPRASSGNTPTVRPATARAIRQVRDAQRAQLIGAAAADLAEAAANKASLRAMRERIDTHVQQAELVHGPAVTERMRGSSRYPAPEIMQPLARMRDEVNAARSGRQAAAAVKRIAAEHGAQLVGKVGDRVQFDPQIHEVFGPVPAGGAQVEIGAPGVRDEATGAILKRAVVYPTT